MPAHETPAGLWLVLFTISAGLLASVLWGPCLYLELQSWQTLIAGLVGFGGIAWVTYKTARLARDRDTVLAQEHAEAERSRRAEQVSSLAMALGWEVAHTARELVTIRRRLIEVLETASPDKQMLSAAIGAARNQLRNIPPPRVFAETAGRLVLPAIAQGQLGGFYYEVAELTNISGGDVDEDDLHRIADRLRLTVDTANGALLSLREICGTPGFPQEFRSPA